MKAAWPTVKLGDVLHRSTETVTPEPDQEYSEITVRLWGNGVVQRGRVMGASINGRRFIARRGQFIASRIDARNGAMGLVPVSLDGALVTNDFPLFAVSSDRMCPEYLGWLSKTQGFVELCARGSEGTTNRVRLKEDKFLGLDIPLPPIVEQRRIVARIEELAAQIGEARALREQVAEQQDALIISTHLKLAGARTRTLGEILHLDEDKSAVEPDGSYPQVGVRSFGCGLFPKGPIGGSETTYKAFNRLYGGALVLSQVKGWEGALAVCPEDLHGWFVSPEYRTFRCVPDEVRPDYLTSLVRTEWFWGRLSDATRGVGARRERTRPEHFLSIEIPMPDIEHQAIAVNVFDGLAETKDLRAETATELDALMPAILDQAFKGEL